MPKYATRPHQITEVSATVMAGPDYAAEFDRAKKELTEHAAGLALTRREWDTFVVSVTSGPGHGGTTIWATVFPVDKEH